MSRMIRKKKRKPRSWIAVSAWFRNAAGQMGDKRKEISNKECRNFKHKKNKRYKED